MGEMSNGITPLSRGRILGLDWDKSLQGFPPCNPQSPLLKDFTPLKKNGLKQVCNVNIVYGNLKSENSPDYAQKPQRNCTFVNLASVSTDDCSDISVDRLVGVRIVTCVSRSNSSLLECPPVVQ